MMIAKETHGFAPKPLESNVRPETSLNFFGDAMKKAFANEDVGERQNAGLSGVSSTVSSEKSSSYESIH